MSTLPPFVPAPNSNTSASGGPLIPSSLGGDFNDRALDRFLQQFVTTITGIPGNCVFPRWRPEPADIPDEGTDWGAIGVTDRKRDTFAYESKLPAQDQATTVFRSEELEILLSFYGPNAQQYAEIFANGLQVAQNREILTVNNMGLIESEDTLAVPAKINERWMRGQDTKFRIRRSIKYTYPVQNVNIANITLYEDTPPSQYSITVQKP